MWPQQTEGSGSTMTSTTTFGTLALALLLSGCGGPDCAALCEDAKKCANAPEDVKKAPSCEKYCEDQEKLAEGAGCESQYEAFLDCEDDADDICKSEETCKAEFEALGACIIK